MNRRSRALIGAGVVGLAGLVVLAEAGRGPEEDPAQPVGAAEEEMHKRAAEDAAAGAPGAVHALLTRRAGEWTFKSRFTLEAVPDGTPIESSGTARITSILGGRFIMMEESGGMAGMEYAGQKLLGYNSSTGEFESTWVYSGSTAMMHMTGTSQDEGKTVTYGASVRDKGVKAAFTIVTKQIDEDSFSVELRGTGEDGTPGGTLVTTYARKK